MEASTMYCGDKERCVKLSGQVRLSEMLGVWKDQEVCYGLKWNELCPFKMYLLKPYPQVIVFGDGAFGR